MQICPLCTALMHEGVRLTHNASHLKKRNGAFFLFPACDTDEFRCNSTGSCYTLYYTWCDGYIDCPGHLEEEADGCRPGRNHSSCLLVFYMIIEIIPHKYVYNYLRNFVSIDSVLAIRLSVQYWGMYYQLPRM